PRPQNRKMQLMPAVAAIGALEPHLDRPVEIAREGFIAPDDKSRQIIAMNESPFATSPVRQANCATGKIAHGTIVVDGRAVEPDHPYLVRHGIEGFAKALIAELKRQRGQHRGSPASPRSWRGTRSLARGGGRGACPQRVRSRFTLARCGLLASSGSVHH